MSDYEDDYEDEYTDDSTIKKVRAAQRAAEKRAKELEARLAEYESRERTRSVQSVLKARGLNEKIAAFIPNDLVDEDAVADWLEQYGDVFGAPAPQPNSGEQGQDGPASFDEQVQQQINDLSSTGQAPVGDEAQMLAMIQGAKSPEDLNKLIFGNQYGPFAT